MDRTLAPEITQRARYRRVWLGLLAVVVLGAGLFWVRHALKTSIESSRIRTAFSEIGPVENTLNASGEVIPAYEQIYTSPIRASIQRVLLRPGARVKPGQALLDLDKSLSEIEYEKLKDELALKRNSIDQLQLKLTKNLYDADISDKIKALNINRLKADLEAVKRLSSVGGSTAENVTEAENRLRIAELEKAQLENDLKYNRQSMSASLREAQLGAQIEERNGQELAHKLKQARVVADRAGVLTWVNEAVGSSVSEGEILAKLADLGSFRVEGSCSDSYAEQVKIGSSVIVKLAEVSLRGLITQVKPAVQNGVVRFTVELDQPQNAALRPNLKTEVFIITQQVPKAVRLANGPVFKGKRRQYVFVLAGKGTSGPVVAQRREVEIGLSNFDFVEIKSGLQPGERIILTDTSDYEHLSEITVEYP